MQKRHLRQFWYAAWYKIIRDMDAETADYWL